MKGAGRRESKMVKVEEKDHSLKPRTKILLILP